MTDTVVVSLIIVGVLVILLGALRLRHVSLQHLVTGVFGAIIGLLLGALASVPLSKLPEPFGNVLPLTLTVVFTFVVMGLLQHRREALLDTLPFLRLGGAKPPVLPASDNPVAEVDAAPIATRSELPQILVDTSVIIDGRIADIAAAGFVPGRLSVPRFVLAELQNIADSENAMRRGRGRRGLDVLNRLREMDDLSVTIIEDDAPNVREVDAKLVALAQRFSCNVLTTDYNLNRVAQIQGVRVLNVNELSNAIRPVVLPGEELIVNVVQPGKERGQGVGYLADGTMIVVENGDKLMGQQVSTEVTRVFQTVAGKMIFATPRKTIGASPVEAPPPKPQSSLPKSSNPVVNSTPETPAKDAKPRKGRFNRRGQSGSDGPAQGTPRSAEERIIAATSPTNRPADQA